MNSKVLSFAKARLVRKLKVYIGEYQRITEGEGGELNDYVEENIKCVGEKIKEMWGEKLKNSIEKDRGQIVCF